MKMKAEKEYSGFFLAFEPRRTEKIAAQLENEQEAAESFSATDWKFKRREIVFLSLDRRRDSIGAAVLMERKRGSGGTGKLMMRMYAPLFIDWPIRADELLKNIDLNSFISSAEQLKRIDADDWGRLIGAIKKLRPEIANKLDALLSKRTEESNISDNSPKMIRLAEQRDALGLTLDIAHLDRSSVMRSMDLSRVGKADSALDLLDSEPLHEQDIIRHDEKIFKNLLISEMRSASFKGSTGREVRIHVYDKKPLETVLGIDLLIYQESYKSFLLLQYKTMERVATTAGNTWSCLVDAQLLKQLKAMNTAEKTINRQSVRPRRMMDWRLNTGAFYFKLCETTRLNARNDSLISGMTINVGHLQNFMTLPESVSDHGGCRVGYENCYRYLSNTQFVDLARYGWIGCGPQGYKFIQRVLEANQKGGKLAMLAVVEGSGAKNAYDRIKYKDKRTRTT